VTLTARWQAATGWRLGLVRRDELIAIHECPVHTTRVRRLVEALAETLPPPDAFPLAYLHVAGAQATLIVKSPRFEQAGLEPLRERLAATGIDGLWVHCHPAAGRKLFARSGWHLAWGVPTSQGPDGSTHGPTAFQQLLPALHAQSLDLAEAFLQPGPDVGVLDLYCGLGISLRRWCDAGAEALGIELAGGAVEHVVRNAPNALVLRGTCLQRLPQVREWWPRHARRVAYVNPPRSGLDGPVLQELAQHLRPARLAYLSCSAGTLARDLVQFEAAGYSVQQLTPFDFFPRTHHVECLALLRLAAG
jgi:tRNA/tmRNA/rRNA uracil-C5-methylase (TrmA/RlmC/RlmD family)